MDRTYIDNHHVVARYLADRLSEDERRAFETYMHTNPDVVQDLEAAARMKVGLRKLDATGELTTLLQPVPWYRNSRNLVTAASIAVVAVAALLWLGRGAVGPQSMVASLGEMTDRSGNPLTVANAYAILRTRGSAYDAEIELPETAKAIELRVLPEIEAHPAQYRITLARVGDDGLLNELASIAKLKPNDDGFVTIYLDSSKFLVGRYRLTLSGDRNTDAGTTESAFKIRFAPPEQRPQR